MGVNMASEASMSNHSLHTVRPQRNYLMFPMTRPRRPCSLFELYIDKLPCFKGKGRSLQSCVWSLTYSHNLTTTHCPPDIRPSILEPAHFQYCSHFRHFLIVCLCIRLPGTQLTTQHAVDGWLCQPQQY